MQSFCSYATTTDATFLPQFTERFLLAGVQCNNRGFSTFRVKEINLELAQN